MLKSIIHYVAHIIICEYGHVVHRAAEMEGTPLKKAHNAPDEQVPNLLEQRNATRKTFHTL